MKTQSVSFIVRANQNGTVEQIGRSSITHPKIVFKGGSIKWFDDSRLLKKTNVSTTPDYIRSL